MSVPFDQVVKQGENRIAGQEAQEQALEAQLDKSGAAQEKELQPLEQKASAAIDDLSTVKPPVADANVKALGDFKPKPTVDAKDYQGLSWALIGMAMVGGAVSKGNWLGTSKALNGAMSGYLKGSEMTNDKLWSDYQKQYQVAKGHDEAAQREFEDILNSKKLTINQILSQMKIAAAKYDRQDIRLQHSIDGMRRQTDASRRSLEQLEARHDDMLTRLQGGPNAKMDPSKLDPGTISMVAAGAPANQVVRGYGKQTGSEWGAYRNAAIQQIMNETGMGPEQAGQELASRQIDYVAGRRSVTQLTLMAGASKQALGQLEFNIDKTTEILKTIPGSDISPVVNAIVRGEQKWTGDPAYSSLFYYMSATSMESARIMSGGQASVAQLQEGAREEAKKWSDINMTPASFIEGVGPAMKAEGANRVATFEAAIAKQRGLGRGPPAEATPLPHPGQNTQLFEQADAIISGKP
jgi:hypothetical protein